MFAGAWSSQFDAVLYVEPAVNRHPGFRRELVEQITSFIIQYQNFLPRKLFKCKFLYPCVFLSILPWKFQISSFFLIFCWRHLLVLNTIKNMNILKNMTFRKNINFLKGKVLLSKIEFLYFLKISFFQHFGEETC